MLAETKETQEESKADFWQRHIEDCSRSSLTQSQYCKEHFLALATFCYWKKKLKLTRQEKARFYPLTVQSSQHEKTIRSSAGLSLHFGNDKFRVDLTTDFCAPTLKKLITTLDQL